MRVLKLALVLLLVAQLAVPFGASAQEINVNLLVQETQKRAESPGEINIIWWFPEDIWRVSLAQTPNITPEQIEATLSVFRPYVIMAAVMGKVDPLGTVTYKSEAEMRANVRLIDASGSEYLPLAEDGINAMTKGYLAMMKPIFANTMGPMGQNMYFFVFVAKDKNGADIADPRKEGIFSVRLLDKEVQWKLPLTSLLPEKTCPTCKQKLSGAYKYCPWDGTPLP